MNVATPLPFNGWVKAAPPSTLSVAFPCRRACCRTHCHRDHSVGREGHRGRTDSETGRRLICVLVASAGCGLPPVVVTVTSTVPAVPAGAVAVTDVAVFTVKVVALVAPNFTAVAPAKFVPVIVTLVPPAVGPLVGLR